jgi:signal transduction histidine kinase
MRARKSLRKRIALAIIFGMSIILLSYAVVSYHIVNTSIQDALDRKLAMAHLIRNRIDSLVEENINRLYDISLSGAVDFADNDPGPERTALQNAYRYSIFKDGIFLLDRAGNVVMNYPERMRNTSVNVMAIEPIGKTVTGGKAVVSNIFTLSPSGRKVLFSLVPLKDRNGREVGTVGGEIDPTNPVLAQILRLVDSGRNEFIDIVDSNGVVIASSKPSRTLTQSDHNRFIGASIAARKEVVRTCHDCHAGAGTGQKRSTNVMIFVPLMNAPWGISMQEPEGDVFAPAIRLRKTFVALGVIFIATALVLTIGISRSIVNPIKVLIEATERISRGELSEPVRVHGNDELGVLSKSFEDMRVKLIASLDSVRKSNVELESRVRERTWQIKESQGRIKSLLKKVITSQEEERKRIARELHDQTLQDLSVIMMRIDMCKLRPDQLTHEKVDEIRDIALKSLEGVVEIIQNLRPSLLDDLGLKAAIGWLLDNHLRDRGIECFFTMAGAEDMRFRTEVEITLFRIIQEAIMNVAKHAKAHNVFVVLNARNGSAHVDIEDDGEGFDFHTLLGQTTHDPRDARGLGLLGMMERAPLIGGKIEICSSPGSGTRVTVKFPLEYTGVENV